MNDFFELSNSIELLIVAFACTSFTFRALRFVVKFFGTFFLTGKRRYNIKLWKTFTDCFNCLPVAAILDEKIFCCHGGEFSQRFETVFLSILTSCLCLKNTPTGERT